MNASGFTVEGWWQTRSTVSGEVVDWWSWILLEQQIYVIIASPAEMLLNCCCMVGLVYLCSYNSHCYVFGSFLAPLTHIPQATSWAPDASMGEVCTSVLFTAIATTMECGQGYFRIIWRVVLVRSNNSVMLIHEQRSVEVFQKQLPALKVP